MSGGAVKLMERQERPAPGLGSKPSPRSKPSPDWRRRMGEAMLLSGYLYEKQNEQSAFPGAVTKADYQKQLVLEAARQHGWMVESRRDLDSQQLGEICTNLRGMIEALGLPGPEHERDARATKTQEPTTSDWKQFTKVYSDLVATPGWNDAHFHAWLKKFHRRRTVRGMGRDQLRAVIRGIEGILKHAKQPLDSAAAGAVARGESQGSSPSIQEF